MRGGVRYMNLFDIPIFDLINHMMSNRFFNFIMPLITCLGSRGFVFAAGVLLLFSRKKETRALGILLIAGLVVSYYAVGALKVIAARPRPFSVLSNAIVLGYAEKGLSFPSGHTATAFMAAALFSNRFKCYPVFYLVAALVGISRVYIGVHFPTDVIGGAIIGCLMGWFLIYAASLVKQRS